MKYLFYSWIGNAIINNEVDYEVQSDRKYVEGRMWFCRNEGNYNYWDLSEEQHVAWWHLNDMNEPSDWTHSTSFVARWYRPTTFNLIYYTTIFKTLRKLKKLHTIDHWSIWSNNHTKTASGLPTMSFLFPFTPFYKIFFLLVNEVVSGIIIEFCRFATNIDDPEVYQCRLLDRLLHSSVQYSRKVILWLLNIHFC